MGQLHAKLSASSAHRWMVCTKCIKLEEQFEDETSTYAEEGTFAHALAELELSNKLELLSKKTFKKEKKDFIKKYEAYYNEELEEYVNLYVEAVLEIYAEAKSQGPDAQIMLEQRVDFSEWVPEGFGTSDVVIIADNVIEVIDLKFGRGLKVSAEDNPQLKLYGIGAYNEYQMLYDVRQVKMTIIQPRLDNISSSKLVVEDLLEWAENYVKPRAELAFNGGGEYIPGDHCKFCKAKHTCRARGDKQLELLKHEFKSPDLFEDDELGELLTKVGKLVDWAKDITDYVYQQATEQGKNYLGWKLVEGRSTRKYKDTIQVANILTAAGYDEAIIYEKNLLTITSLEKALGKKTVDQLLEGLIIKPQGKPTLVPETDKRSAMNLSLKDEF